MKTFMIVMVLGMASVLHAAPRIREHALGPVGEIPVWLALGYLPIEAAKETWAASMEADLLEPVGGELGIRPQGGETATLVSGTYVWRVAPAWAPPYGGRPGWGPVMRRPLFQDPQGKAIEYSVVYLYCRLHAEQAIQPDFLFGSDDGVKLILNGEEIHRFVGARSAQNDTEIISLPLRAGENHLLVRVDNYPGTGAFVGRLLNVDGTPPTDVRVRIPADDETPVLPIPDRPDPKPWAEVIAEIPPVPPAFHEEFFGARLTRTMALLQDSAQTRRPVRIVFYGQSITDQEWTQLLIERLRERFPGALIESEKHSWGGWPVRRLKRAMDHGMLQSRPDLVVFHAYQGTSDDWERVLSAFRKETSAEIMIRTHHVARRDWPLVNPERDREVTLIRRLAQKYDCELVEGLREWSDYLSTYDFNPQELLRDGIHLNRKGNVLMAQLYERHFREQYIVRSGWTDSIRWHEALHPLRDRRSGAMKLEGDGWRTGSKGHTTWLESDAPADSLTLRFRGRRVDVVLAPRSGSAAVLINGRPPSEHNLFYGTLAKFKVSSLSRHGIPTLYRYFTGPDMVEETWEMRFNRVSADGRRFGYVLHGSVTGFDGEGTSDADFVSNSGRIRLALEDMERRPPAAGAELPPLEDVANPGVLTWKILPRFHDTIRWQKPAESREWITDWHTITVADGLDDGEHTLTLTPLGDGPVGIRGVEVHRPPLAGER